MSSQTRNASDGDWTCEDSKCGNVNFARRSSCNRCGKEKSPVDSKKQGIEIGKAAAEKSHGLFSADDWQCSKCGNVNWARRSTCNMCNAPRVGDVEERTGYGGGFNERVGVEYVRRSESDDEFDDYGRPKKKKTRMNDPVTAMKPAAITTNECEEEDDDDEEDDCDLSKYDLWDDDDDDELTKNTQEPMENPSVEKNGGIKSVNKTSPSPSYSSSSRSSYSRSRSSDSSDTSSRSRSRSPQRKSKERSRTGQTSRSKRRYYDSRSRSRSADRKYAKR